MRKLKLFSLALMALFSTGLWAADVSNAAYGFEDNSTSGFTNSNATLSISSEARTGTMSLKTDYNGNSDRRIETVATFSIPNGSTMYAIGYAKLLDSDNTSASSSTQAYLDAYIGGNSTHNTINLTTTWQRMTSYKKPGSAQTGKTLRIQRKHAGKGSVLFDDIVIYVSTESKIDLKAPSSATNATATTSAISWDNGTDESDNNNGATGIQNTLIWKRTAESAEDLTLNNQGKYVVPAEGSTLDQSKHWTLVSSSVAADATSYSEEDSFTPGDVYAIVHRDLAYNYSDPVYVTIPEATNYTIIYDNNGGNGTMDNTINIVAPCTFTHDSKMFVNWNTEANGSGTPYAAGDNVTGNITLYAQWATGYDVTFSTGVGSGTVPAPFEKWEGAKFNLPGQGEMVAPSGKAFSGWKANGTGDLIKEGDEYTMIGAAVEFVAQWATVLITKVGDVYSINTSDFITGGTLQNDSYTVEGTTYAKHVQLGGQCSVVGSIDNYNKVVMYNTKTNATHIKIALYDKYSSNTTQHAYVVVRQEGNATPLVNEDISITTSTKRDCEKEYNITGRATIYVMVGHTDIRICQIEVIESGSVNAVAPAVGYTMNLNAGRMVVPVTDAAVEFEGISYYLAEKYQPTSASAKITTNNTHYVSFEIPSGQTRQLQLTTSSTEKYTVSKTKGDTENQITPTASTAKNFNLTEGVWYINPQGKDVTITNIAFAAAPELLTVTFNSNGGSDVAAASVWSGDQVAEPTAPTKSGYRFNGWKLNSAVYDFSAAVTESITLVADWIQVYTISFADGGGSGDAPAAIEPKAEGETFEVPANTFTAPEGKTFDKWNDGTNDYAPEATYTVGTANVTLTAVWKDNGGGTALDNTADEAKAVKRIENGMLIIEKNGKTYNVLGTVVK